MHRCLEASCACCKSELTELNARDASCPKGKKMEHKMSLLNRDLRRDCYEKGIGIIGGINLHVVIRRL